MKSERLDGRTWGNEIPGSVKICQRLLVPLLLEDAILIDKGCAIVAVEVCTSVSRNLKAEALSDSK